MGRGVADAVVGRKAEGQKVVVLRVLKGKLQDLHAGQPEIVPELFHLGGDDAEVLRPDRQILAELLLKPVKQGGVGPFSPLPGHGRLCAVGDLVVGLKSAEMVDAQIIHQAKLPLDAAYPPGIAGLLVVIPVIERVAPELARRGEIIRRNPGHHGRVAVLLQLEELPVRPHVRTVDGGEDGNIPDNLHAVYMGVLAQRVPLPEEEKLDIPVVLDLIGQTAAPFCLDIVVRVAQVILPLQPAAALVGILSGHEQGVILKPVLFLLAEGVKLFEKSDVRAFLENGEGTL